MDEEDENIFKAAMKGIKRLKSTPRQAPPAPPKRIKRQRHEASYQSARQEHTFGYEIADFHTPLNADDTLAYHKQGVQPKTVRQLRQGKVRIAGKLDLHQTRTAEVFDITDHFIQNACARQLKCVLIVHGKGFYSKAGIPMIKNMLNDWLRNHSDVVAFHSATPRDGGTGAIYVLLKTRNEAIDEN
jgi:DNA-nicking Smr family endonuclease